MRITIVTISFNQSRFLRQCIDSVLTQTDCDLEYIVVDPGSTDGSRELIESYGKKIIPVFEPDRGPADGLNHGFAQATGQIFGFINADDYLLPGALSAINHHFEIHGLDHFVSGSGFIKRSEELIRVRPTRLTKIRSLYGVCTLFQQGTFFPAWMFRAVGGFNIENRTCWDGELFTCFLGTGYPHALIDRDLAVFILHDDSISGSGRLNEEYKRDRQRIFHKHMGRSITFFDRCAAVLFRFSKIIMAALPSRWR